MTAKKCPLRKLQKRNAAYFIPTEPNHIHTNARIEWTFV